MIKLTSEVNLEGCTLVVPSVAVGNVAQLTVDLLICNLEMQRIGRVLNFGFIPVVGLDPYSEDSADICTATDLYANIDKKVVALQVRSPLVNKPTEFYNKLELFVKEHKLSKVVILTSCYAYEARENLSDNTCCQYVASSDVLVESQNLSQNIKSNQDEPKSHSFIKSNEERCTAGGGYAKNLYRALSGAGIPSVILFTFCSEGDNIPDAFKLTKHLNQWMHLMETNSNGRLILKYPPSWKYFFGNPPSGELY